MRLLILFGLFAFGCADKPKDLKVDEPLVPYVEAFEAETSPIESLEAVLVEDLGERILGKCSVNGKARKIEIARSFWIKSGHWSRRELMFHELAHCFLNKKHNNLKDEWGQALSIMNEYHQGESVYNETTHKAYDKELFR